MTPEADLAPRSTVDPDEVARFSALASEWWDPRGRMGMLHKFNPVRLGFIKEAACRHFDRDSKSIDALAGLRVLDIGCGGGLLSEPLARLGGEVVGADASHAWVELWCGSEIGFLALDPTNDIVPSDRHVIVAYGRDFSDVSPVKGMILGGGQAEVSVGVDVERL